GVQTCALPIFHQGLQGVELERIRLGDGNEREQLAGQQQRAAQLRQLRPFPQRRQVLQRPDARDQRVGSLVQRAERQSRDPLLPLLPRRRRGAVRGNVHGERVGQGGLAEAQ